ncbi:MAG: hypothetical protein JRD01_10405 [Deltaproteobacteria bacterium]|nr:hypothetical protein [Deltaproteobacteria bacterium]
MSCSERCQACAKWHEGNWIKTMPGKSWNCLLRLYGPLQPWHQDFRYLQQICTETPFNDRSGLTTMKASAA